MKTHLKQLIRTSLKGMAVAALLVAGSVQTSQAGSSDPSAGGSFTWDLLSSGSGQRGIALITFNSDLTFRGYQLLAATPPKNNTNSSSDDGRGGDNDGRGGSGSSGGKTNNFLFGFSPIDGVWQINSKGQIVGFFTEAVNVTSEITNYLASSQIVPLFNNQNSETTNIVINFANGQATVSTNFAWANPPGYFQVYTFNNPNATVEVGSAETTNTVSFTGKSSSNKRIDLVCSTTLGKVTYKGIPAVTGLDLTGTWMGVKRENGVDNNEFFDLASFSTGNPFPLEFPDIANFPNVFFTTNGVGPGYNFTGVAIFSQKKTVGFNFINADGTMRSVIGSLKATKHGPTANTTGIEEPNSRVTFNATLQ